MNDDAGQTPPVAARDDALLSELGALTGQLDPMPDNVRAAALFSFRWRSPGAVVAGLAHDSLLTDSRALVRGAAAGPRLLTFEVAGSSIELQAVTEHGVVRITGQLVPAQDATVTVRHAGGEVTVSADALGRFRADGVAPGPLSVRCRLRIGTDETDVVTEWVSL